MIQSMGITSAIVIIRNVNWAPSSIRLRLISCGVLAKGLLPSLGLRLTLAMLFRPYSFDDYICDDVDQECECEQNNADNKQHQIVFVTWCCLT